MVVLFAKASKKVDHPKSHHYFGECVNDVTYFCNYVMLSGINDLTFAL